jgi:hypothetical protein
MPTTLSWILAFTAVAAFLVVALVVVVRRRNGTQQLPTEWALTPRPVFSTDERRVYRQLREALPHHIVRSKLPLVRFCQPNDPNDVRYWYELLGSIHVTFAICSANGRVLAAIDLDTDRSNSRRSQQIKQAVLSSCRVRYLRCPIDNLPSIAELQLLVPGSSATRGPLPAPAHTIHRPRDGASSTSAPRRRERTTLWQDSSLFNDSFFAPDTRTGPDTATPSDFAALSSKPAAPTAPAVQPNGGSHDDADDIAGVVVDAPRYGSSATRH